MRFLCVFHKIVFSSADFDIIMKISNIELEICKTHDTFEMLFIIL